MKYLHFMATFLLLASTVHAQVDAGRILFVDILRVASYPGAPFSGIILNDVVLYFLLPTVLIMVFIYTLMDAMFDNKKIRLLMSVSAYLFIVFGGFFSIFVNTAELYFFFMLVIGAIWFILRHFRGGKKLDTAYLANNAIEHMSPHDRKMLALPSLNHKQKIEIEKEIHNIDMRIEHLTRQLNNMTPDNSGRAKTINKIDELHVQRQVLLKKLEDMRKW